MLFHLNIKNPPAVKEFHLIERNKSSPPGEVHDYNILVIVIEGQVMYVINNQEYKLKKGDAFFIPANQDYFRQAVDNHPCRHCVIHFGSDFSEIHNIQPVRKKIQSISEKLLKDISSFNYISAPLFTDLYFEQLVNLEEDLDKACAIINMAWQDLLREDINTQLILSLCVSYLLVIINRITLNKILFTDEIALGAKVPEKIKNAVIFIRNNYKKKVNLKELCDYCNMSPQHLIRQFRSAYNVTPLRYINTLKMARAKEMLRITSMSVKEIAAEIGIEDPSYFSRLYKKTTGEYPLHYRNKAIIIEENDRNLVK